MGNVEEGGSAADRNVFSFLIDDDGDDGFGSLAKNNKRKRKIVNDGYCRQSE